MNYPRISIVIPVFNRITFTVQCIESLKNIVYPNFEIIIVDHGSTDGTSEVIKKNYPCVVLVQGDENMWWSKATNMGIRRAISNHSDYVLFLNNDDEVDAFILHNLVNCSRDYPEAIIGCKVCDFNQPNMLIFTGGECDWKNKGLLSYGHGEVDAGQYDIRKEIKWIPGAGTFVKVDLFQKIGFIDDESFPHYAADIDFTLRAYETGYKIIFEPTAVLYKKMGKNSTSTHLKENIFITLISPLFSVRSPINLSLQLKFLWRHCPKKYMLKMFFYKYYNYYKGFLNLEAFLRYLNSKHIHG